MAEASAAHLTLPVWLLGWIGCMSLASQHLLGCLEVSARFSDLSGLLSNLLLVQCFTCFACFTLQNPHSQRDYAVAFPRCMLTMNETRIAQPHSDLIAGSTCWTKSPVNLHVAQHAVCCG